jgi:uncharacterized protein
MRIRPVVRRPTTFIAIAAVALAVAPDSRVEPQSPSQDTRPTIAVMYFTTAIFISEIVGQTTLSQLRDKDTYNPTILLPSLWNLRRCPYLKREMWRRLLSYCRPGFHPDDWDATEIVEHWKQELFGEEGTFVDTLR